MPPLSAGTHEFVGTDLNPAPFPQSVRPNVRFAVQDIKKPWPESQHGQFDLVHQRLTLLGAGPNPSASISHLYSIVKPGGWVQISEGTMDFPPDVVSEEQTPAYSDMIKTMQSVAAAVGAEWHSGRFLRGWLEEAGFTDVGEEDVILNMGRTNKDDKLAKEGAETCGIAVQGLAKFAKCKHSASSYPSQYLGLAFAGTLHEYLGMLSLWHLRLINTNKLCARQPRRTRESRHEMQMALYAHVYLDSNSLGSHMSYVI